jgi:hypothetical protein
LQEHIQHLHILFKLFSEICIYLNFDKTFLGFPSITLLEQKIDDLGIFIIEKKIKAVSSLKFLTILQDLKFYLDFID